MEHLYIVSYDIRNQRRWKRVFSTMHGYGEWLQLSVFQCRLGKIRVLELEAALNGIVKHDEDHVLIMDLGPADQVQPKVQSIGKPFTAPSHLSVVV